MMNRVLKILTIIMAVLLVIGIPVFCYTFGQKNMAQNEFKETAEQMQESINDNEHYELMATQTDFDRF